MNNIKRYLLYLLLEMTLFRLTKSSDMFTSTAKMRELLSIPKTIHDMLQKYIEDETNRLESLKMLIRFLK